jgi:2-succinyl-5-enolpyruvyl-6-hydroxy-3-cyclohexene-1-carboxylate synthase
MCEGTVLVRLRDLLPAGTALHVGNSLPVRALDTFVGGSARALVVVCNRGASGIDGVVSTALGAAAVRAGPTVLVVGDLSFLHDVGALQIAARHRVSLLVIVVNNDGGGIFSFLPQASLGTDFETFFATPHGLDLAGAVAMCNGRHAVVTSWEEFATAVEGALSRWGLDVIEVRSDRALSRERHARILDAALARVGAALPRVEAR